MDGVSQKPWWRRLDGAPPGVEEALRRNLLPWTSRTIWFMRAAMVAYLALAIAFAVGAAKGSPGDLGLAIGAAVFLAFQWLRWTPTQRRQMLGRRPPRDRR